MIFCNSAGKIRLLAIFILPFLTLSCDQKSGDLALDKGQSLAKKYCSNCHLFPTPELLDKRSWTEGVLPAMAVNLGIEVLEGNMYLHHKESALSSPEWQEIIRYYKTLAPESLPQTPRKKLARENNLFTVIAPKDSFPISSSTTMVAIDTSIRSVISGDASERAITYWNEMLQSTKRVSLPSPPIQYLSQNPNRGSLVTCLGSMQALDITIGQIMHLDQKKDPVNLFPGFIRPVYTQAADLDNDGLTDYIVSAFGHNRGGLYAMHQKRNGTFKKAVIREVPGATQSVVRDFNRDGWADIMALFAHGDEGIWIFINDKKGGFIEKNVLRFPPVYGSSSFQLVDMDGDGMEDILYTAGDNSDYSRVLKPYHGLYIFSDKGGSRFTQTFFYPINGCTKAMAADFDHDGDMDIATISFFADFKNKPEETFLYFDQNKKTGSHFIPKTLPIRKLGRWICMDVNDLDDDGDADIVLGNYSRGFLNQESVNPDWDQKTPFIVLQNNTKK